MFLSAPKIGSGNTLLWVFLGQMYFALIIGKLGLFGLDPKPINFGCGLKSMLTRPSHN